MCKDCEHFNYVPGMKWGLCEKRITHNIKSVIKSPENDSYCAEASKNPCYDKSVGV